MTFLEKSKSLQAKATKTPWEIFGNKTYSDVWRSPFSDEKEKIAVECFTKNTEYIVHCVNTHAKLCELLIIAMAEIKLCRGRSGIENHTNTLRDLQEELDKL